MHAPPPVSPDRISWIASLIVLSTGVLWGLYWLPVRRLADVGLDGPWGSLAIVAAAAVLLAPFAVAARRRLAAADRRALGAIALGGASFTLYSVGLAYGQVAVVVLLFFLTPVWSTLIGRLLLGWRIPRLRALAIVCGLAGLGLVLGADGGVPLPAKLGDWLGLASGLLWSLATTGMRLYGQDPNAPSDVRPGEAAFVFAIGAVAAAAPLAALLAPWPGLPPPAAWPQAALWVLAGGGLWWGLSMAGLTWAAGRLEPARVGILLMSEVLIAIVSSALLLGEALGPVGLAGAGLVVAAAVLEVWPVRR
jgi:drug/metabolite transporter (DMT)-like permease